MKIVENFGRGRQGGFRAEAIWQQLLEAGFLEEHLILGVVIIVLLFDIHYVIHVIYVGLQFLYAMQ